MYLGNLLSACHHMQRSVSQGKCSPIDYVSFRQYFEDLAFAYEIGATSYIDYEFEYLTDAIWTVSGKEKTDGLDDLEFLHVLVRRVFVEFKDNKSGLNLLMSKLYWNFTRDDFEGVWNCLVDYYNTAAGVKLFLTE